MFERAGHVIMTKIDLLPHVPFSLDRAIANVLSINPSAGVFRMSALDGWGLEEWFEFLRRAAVPAGATA